MVLYLNAIQPKHFEEGASSSSAQEIDLNLAFDFIFTNAAESEKLGRLTFKDVSETSLGLALLKVDIMFKLLAFTLRSENVRAQQYGSEGVNFQMVELNMQEIFLSLEAIAGIQNV